MVAAARYLEKFNDYLDTKSVSFPLYMYEWQSSQSLTTKFTQAIGADYAHDAFGWGAIAKEPSREVVRFLVLGASPALLDSTMDNLRAKCHSLGRGKLYTLDSNGVRRWCWARSNNVPGFQVSYDMPRVAPMSLDFTRLSDWHATSETTGSATITTSPQEFTITNSGDTAAKAVTLRFRANTATGFTNPNILNLLNGYEISSTRDAASVDSEIRVDNGRMAVEWSNDDGVTYANDYANVTLGAGQVGLMNLEPGDNTLRYTDGGTPSLAIQWAFYPTFI